MTEEKKKEEEDYPIMFKSQFTEGQSMMKSFLKGIDIKVRGCKVRTTYIWEFPDKLVAKSFAEGMKTQFEGGEE